MQSNTIKMQKSGRVTIPAPIRRLVNLKTGDLLEFKYRSGKIICAPQK